MKKVHLLYFCLFVCVQYANSQWLPGYTIAGGNGTGPASNQLFNPQGVFVDASKNLYVADLYNSRIQKWASGASQGVTMAGGNGYGPAANQFRYAADVFVDPVGNIYIADQANNRIQLWAPGASFGVTVAGGNGFGSATNQFNGAYGVFVDASKNIYIADYFNNRVQKWAPGALQGVTVAGGNGFGAAANQLSFPSGVFVDVMGNIYVADLLNDRIQKWTPGANMGITVAGGNGKGSALNQLSGPSRVFIDASGNLFIADRGNYRIQMWAPGASAGITVAGGNGFGSADNQLADAYAIFVDAKRNLYVADAENHRVQKFDFRDTSIVCPTNLTFNTPSCNGKATITWTEPHDSFPAIIRVKAGINLTAANLRYKGTFNGHGYYESNDQYSWLNARDAATAVGAHLITITSAAESNFVFTNLNQQYNFAWIGLYNTGQQGGFAWVTGEPVSYTNWIPGQPDNLYGMSNPDPTIFEPYVQINGWADPGLCRWNDNSASVNARFLAEFDNTEHSYRQVAGPSNGSQQSPGVYNICYERINNSNLQKDTCCFSVTVSCNSVSTETIHPSSVTTDINKDLHVFAFPNPSSNFFKLQIAGSNNTERINVQVSDIAGRTVENRNGLAANQMLEIGRTLRPGVYFVQVTRGIDKTVIKLIKQ